MSEDELMTEVTLPPAVARGLEFSRIRAARGRLCASRRWGDVGRENGGATNIKIAVAGVGETPIRIVEAETALNGRTIDPVAVADVIAAVEAN